MDKKLCDVCHKDITNHYYKVEIEVEQLSAIENLNGMQMKTVYPKEYKELCEEHYNILMFNLTKRRM